MIHNAPAPFYELRPGGLAIVFPRPKDSDVGNNVGNNETIILDAIKNTPSITTQELAELLGVTQRHCERILSAMRIQGLIKRIGTKKGHWEIVKREQ